MAKKLTKDEKKFCKLYAKIRNHTQTKLILGYTVNINKARILKYINSIPVKGSFIVSEDDVLRQFSAIAYFDHAQMVDKDGDVKPYHLLTTEQQIAIKSFNDKTGYYTTHSKTHALEWLGKYLRDEKILKQTDKPEDDTEFVINIAVDPRSKAD